MEADRPFGLQAGGGYRVQALKLEVGDRLIFVTDGMLERDAERMNIAAILTAGLNMHPREAVQHLTQAVLRQAAASYVTTPRLSVSTGTAAHHVTAKPRRVQTAIATQSRRA